MPGILLLFWAVLGLCVGSFCNVLIFRIPQGEPFVRARSRCMTCGHVLRWYELLPLCSFLAQRGRCRVCGARLSRQYPAVEAVNALAWLLAARLCGADIVSAALLSGLTSVLLCVALIDWRTFTIPNGLNLTVLVLGLLRLATDAAHWQSHLLGMVSLGGLFLLLWALTRGQGLGMGDVKLMAGAGLFLGGLNGLLAMTVGSLLGAVVHSLRMGRGAGRKLAFGPYLAAGIWFAAFFGQRVWTAWLALF